LLVQAVQKNSNEAYKIHKKEEPKGSFFL